jgi:hypothetical protein
MADNRFDGVLVGGPRDGARLRSEGSAVVELEIEGLLHRYHVTTKRREHDGVPLTVYTYDGVIDPSGAKPGVEKPETGAHAPVDRDRLAD